MSLSPLKFSFSVSVLVHGLVIGGAVWLGKFQRTTAIVNVGDVTTLELIAAPAHATERVVETSVAANLPVTTPPLPTEQPETPPSPPEVASVELPKLPPVEEAILASPLHAPEPKPEPERAEESTVPPVLFRETSPAPPPQFEAGDGSSTEPGHDLISKAGAPTATAKPDYLKNPEPAYPLTARRRGQQGTVLLDVTVTAEGNARNVAIKKSSGYDSLDAAALSAVRNWEFEPARLGAIRIESKIEVPVRFTLTP